MMAQFKCWTCQSVFIQREAWVQLGSDIDGEAAGDLFGYSVSMNAMAIELLLEVLKMMAQVQMLDMSECFHTTVAPGSWGRT